MPTKVGIHDRPQAPRKDLKREHRAGLIQTMKGGWVYIVTDQPNGTLYIGVTSDLARRIWEHREGVHDGFTKRYRLNRLVWSERFDDIRDAIACEKRMKEWKRAWKVKLILASNPEWLDLYEDLNR